MLFRQLIDDETKTYTYLVACPRTKEALLIDPVREQMGRDLKLVDELGLTLRYVLDTHVHADHVTAAGPIADRTGAHTGSGGEAKCADQVLKHGVRLALGDLEIEVLATPGHTPDSLSFRIGDHVFTGDALLVRGTGRTDFQNGDPSALYHSLTAVLFELPDPTRVWPGHDYAGHTSSTIGEERQLNPRVAGRTREEFVALMNALDLPNPKKIHEAVPANLACGRDD